jgi:CDP-diacylglycerol--glycerol-3-phosphate 3-phosphatidyltransferase/cardiolipin synthase
MSLTLATKITIGRIVAIPVFVWLAAVYGVSVRDGAPKEAWRLAAIGVFILASVSDAVDGIVARSLNQRSRLGSILDPIADKALLVSAILTLSLSWPEAFPLWFPMLVIGRDLVAVVLALCINHITRKVELVPHWTGKFATFFQMVACSWIMLRFEARAGEILIVVAGVFTAASAACYLSQALRHLTEHGESREIE